MYFSKPIYYHGLKSLSVKFIKMLYLYFRYKECPRTSGGHVTFKEKKLWKTSRNINFGKTKNSHIKFDDDGKPIKRTLNKVKNFLSQVDSEENNVREEVATSDGMNMREHLQKCQNSDDQLDKHALQTDEQEESESGVNNTAENTMDLAMRECGDTCMADCAKEVTAVANDNSEITDKTGVIVRDSVTGQEIDLSLHIVETDHSSLHKRLDSLENVENERGVNENEANKSLKNVSLTNYLSEEIMDIKDEGRCRELVSYEDCEMFTTQEMEEDETYQVEEGNAEEQGTGTA